MRMFIPMPGGIIFADKFKILWGQVKFIFFGGGGEQVKFD
jgi:hypothetical protein